MISFTILGWVGNACFFSRFLVQWWASERARRSVAPRIFWWLSLSGALLRGTYSLARHEPVMLAGFSITTCIYLRNLFLAYGSRSLSTVRPGLLVLLALAGAAGLITVEGVNVRGQLDDAPGWMTIGLIGQSLFSSRFLIQWYMSERAGHSYFPRAFWYVSLAGNVLLLVYAIHLRDPIFIAGFALGPFVQLRNLTLSSARAVRDAHG